MKVLTIGTDRKLFEKESKITERVVLYGTKMEALHIIVFALKSSQIPNTKYQLSENTFVHPTNSSSRWMFVWDAIKLGKKIIEGEETPTLQSGSRPKASAFVRGQAVITCQDPFECGFVGWRLSKIFRLPLHLQIHTDFLSPYFKTSFHQHLRVAMAKFLLPRAAGIRVVSKRIADSITQAGIHLKKTAQILPILVDTGSWVLQSNNFRQSFPFTILMASRLTKEKRITDALQVMKNVIAQYPQTGLIIAGEGPEKKNLEAEAIRLDIEKSVIFLGWQDNLPALMQQAQVFLSTSEYEGYGMSMIEAGLTGVPIVATHAGVAGEMLQDGKNALICPVGDATCLAGKIIQLIHDEPLRLRLSQNAREIIQTSLPTKENYVAAYVEGLESVQTSQNK